MGARRAGPSVRRRPVERNGVAVADCGSGARGCVRGADDRLRRPARGRGRRRDIERRARRCVRESVRGDGERREAPDAFRVRRVWWWCVSAVASGNGVGGVGSHTAGCGTRRVTLPAMRAGSCCDPRMSSKVASAAPLPALPGARRLDIHRIGHSSRQQRSTGPRVTSDLAARGGGRTAGGGSRCVANISSGIVTQRPQQWSSRQTWARGAEFGGPGTSRAGSREDRRRAMPPPL